MEDKRRRPQNQLQQLAASYAMAQKRIMSVLMFHIRLPYCSPETLRLYAELTEIISQLKQSIQGDYYVAKSKHLDNQRENGSGTSPDQSQP